MVSNSRKVRLMSATLGFSSIELVIWLWISCNLATLALSQNNFYTSGRYGKKGDKDALSVVPFQQGGRYGRSGTDKIKSINSQADDSQMLRFDRFHAGSRYGKRAHLQSYNMASLKRFEAALNYLDPVQHAELIKREGRINYKSNENNDNKEKQEPKTNRVLWEMLRKHVTKCC